MAEASDRPEEAKAPDGDENDFLDCQQADLIDALEAAQSAEEQGLLYVALAINGLSGVIREGVVALVAAIRGSGTQ